MVERDSGGLPRLGAQQNIEGKKGNEAFFTTSRCGHQQAGCHQPLALPFSAIPLAPVIGVISSFSE